jgi:class 3 adenylate cyclase/CheY-like chemotaxis protein
MAPSEAADSIKTEAPAAGSAELLSKIRHDLKTPLNQIIGYGEMLLEDAEAGGSEDMASLLRKLLDSAHSSLDLQAKFLNRPAEEVTATTWEELQGEQSGRTSGMTDLLRLIRHEPAAMDCAADLDRIGQAVQNLRSLAREAPARWQNPSAPVAPKPSEAEPAPSVARSTGIRIPGVLKAKPVFSTASEVAETDRPVGAARGRILVVDDNEANRDMLSRRLEREGYELAVAADGTECLQRLETEAFDLILLDIIMPGLDGFEVLKCIRANAAWNETAIIMISALDQIESVVRCIEMGAEDYLPKPFDPVLLRARIGSLLERKRLRDEDRRRAVQMESALREAEVQKNAAEKMLRNILPQKVASELRERGTVEPMYFEDVTIGFTDFVGFTLSTERLAAEELVGLLHEYFTAFDRIVARHGLEKMKTIGDSYMFASGLPERQPSHPVDAVLAALEMVETVRNMARPEALIDWKIRIGLHTGPVIAGVVGIHKFAFDIWGDSVNFASRMESSGEANRLNISERTYSRVKDFFRCTPRGKIHTKDGREVDMYFVEGAHEKLLDDRTAVPPPSFARRYKIYFQKEPKAFPEFLLNR